MKFKKILFSLFLFSVQFCAWAAKPPVISDGGILPGDANTGEQEGFWYVVKYLAPGLVNNLMLIILSVSVLMIMVGGGIYIFSSGDSEMTKKGKETLLWTIVGTVLAIMSYGIIKLLVGIDFTK